MGEARTDRSIAPVLWYFAITYVLTLIGQGVHLYVVDRLAKGTAGGDIESSPVWAWMPYAFYVTNTGPSLAGLFMTYRLFGFSGVWRIFSQLLPWSVGRSWAILAVCLFLPLLVVTIPRFLSLGDAPKSPGSWSLPQYLYTAVVSAGLLGSGICEEIGWRGFALSQLQRRFSALTSSVVVGLAWALWHWPNYFLIDSPSWWRFAALFPMSIVASIIYTWVFNSTGGSLFAVVLLHGAVVATSQIGFAATTVGAFGAPVLYLFVAAGIILRYGATTLSPKERFVVRQPPDG